MFRFLRKRAEGNNSFQRICLKSFIIFAFCKVPQCFLIEKKNRKLLQKRSFSIKSLCSDTLYVKFVIEIIAYTYITLIEFTVILQRSYRYAKRKKI